MVNVPVYNQNPEQKAVQTCKLQQLSCDQYSTDQSITDTFMYKFYCSNIIIKKYEFIFI